MYNVLINLLMAVIICTYNFMSVFSGNLDCALIFFLLFVIHR